MNQPNPFNPAKPANPSEMVGRGMQIRDFERFLIGAMNGSPISMAITGIRGIGKTSLLAKFEEIALKNNCIAIRLEAEENSFSRTEDIYKELLRNLDRELTKRSALKKWSGRLKEFIDSFSFQITYNDIGVKIGAREKETEHLPVIFREKMIEIWRNVKNDVPAVVFMIDEAECLEQIKGALMSLRNTFSRLAENGCGYTIVLSGKMTFDKEMSDIFSPLTRFFHTEKLSPLTKEETKAFISKELEKAGAKIESACIEKIVADSEGHPYIINVMGHVLYAKLDNGEKTIRARHYEKNFGEINDYLAIALFDGMHSKVADSEKPILLEIAKEDGEATTSQIAKNLRKKQNTISSPLQRLVDKNCIIKVKRGRYKIFHRLFRQYILQNTRVN